MKILISGKSGYLANQLKEFNTANLSHKVRLVSVRDEIPEFGRSEVFIHTAGIVHKKKNIYSLEDYIRVNQNLTYKLASKAKEQGIKHFIFLSTMAVYGDSVEKINEKTPLNPKTFYGISKLAAERDVLSLANENFKVSIIRPPMIYGKNCPGNYNFLRKIAIISPFFPDIENKRSMIYIDNFCEFIYELIEMDVSGIYHPQDKNYVTTSKLVKLIALSNNKKIYLSKNFAVLVNLVLKKSKLYKKAFGNLYYDQRLSKKDEIIYHTHTLEKAIKQTESR